MKTKINKSDLKKIYNIACTDWKKKIKDYASKDPFTSEIEFTEKQIKEMLSASTPDQLPVVKEVFEVKDTFESIDSVELACRYLGESDQDVKELRLLENIKGLSRKLLSGQELTVIIKALNEKEKLDWDNSSQVKYYLWWYLGSSFRLNDCYYGYSYSDTPAHLCFKSRDIALYAASKFKNIFEDHYNN